MLHKANVIYLDLHKTGSTFLVDFFNDAIPGRLGYFAKHGIPSNRNKSDDQVWILSVRDPLSYYVSLWSYGGQSHKGLWKAIDPALRGDLYGKDPESFQRWLRCVMLGEGLVGAGSAGRRHSTAARRASELGVGLYTFRLVEMATTTRSNKRSVASTIESMPAANRQDWFAAVSNVDEVIRLETLMDDVKRVIARPDVPTRRGTAWRLHRSTASNTSNHGRVTEYYDAELRELVRQRDSLVFDVYYP